MRLKNRPGNVFLERMLMGMQETARAWPRAVPILRYLWSRKVYFSTTIATASVTLR